MWHGRGLFITIRNMMICSEISIDPEGKIIWAMTRDKSGSNMVMDFIVPLVLDAFEEKLGK